MMVRIGAAEHRMAKERAAELRLTLRAYLETLIHAYQAEMERREVQEAGG